MFASHSVSSQETKNNAHAEQLLICTWPYLNLIKSIPHKHTKHIRSTDYGGYINTHTQLISIRQLDLMCVCVCVCLHVDRLCCVVSDKHIDILNGMEPTHKTPITHSYTYIIYIWPCLCRCSRHYYYYYTERTDLHNNR